MRIGGYYMSDVGYGLKVVEHEGGWSFWLQGDDAQQFRDCLLYTSPSPRDGT